MNQILGKKVGMTQIFLEDGKAVPVTVLKANDLVVSQIKTVEKDGYNAIQYVWLEDGLTKKHKKPVLKHLPEFVSFEYLGLSEKQLKERFFGKVSYEEVSFRTSMTISDEESAKAEKEKKDVKLKKFIVLKRDQVIKEKEIKRIVDYSENLKVAEVENIKIKSPFDSRFLKEARTDNISTYKIRDIINFSSVISEGDKVNITGTSIGHGFTGTIKRFGFHGGRKTHGSRMHRAPGSIGTCSPTRTLKGRRLPGHTGNENVTIKNLQVVKVDKDKNLILVKGGVPGPRNGKLVIRKVISKGKRQKV